MTNSSLIKKAALSALGVFAYVALLAALLQNIQRFVGEIQPGILAAAATLTLFIISACVTSSLVLLRPVLMYLEGSKKDALKLFSYTVASLAVLAVLALVILAAR